MNGTVSGVVHGQWVLTSVVSSFDTNFFKMPAGHCGLFRLPKGGSLDSVWSLEADGVH